MELRKFGTMSLELSSDGLFFLGETPVGKRVIQEINGVTFKGERFDAHLKGAAAADWLAIDGNGIATFDIRMTLETEEDQPAILYLNYVGKADWSAGMGQGPVYVTAVFEAGDERYRWLNSHPVVGKGVVQEGAGLVYEFCELV